MAVVRGFTGLKALALRDILCFDLRQTNVEQKDSSLRMDMGDEAEGVTLKQIVFQTT